MLTKMYYYCCHFNRFLVLARAKTAFFLCDYRQTLLFNSIPVPVIACILDFNNGLEYYQTANTLITSLVLWLFDNSIFHCHLLCLMALYTQRRRRRNSNISRGAIVWLRVTYSIPYFPKFYLFYSSFHSTCTAVWMPRWRIARASGWRRHFD